MRQTCEQFSRYLYSDHWTNNTCTTSAVIAVCAESQRNLQQPGEESMFTTQQSMSDPLTHPAAAQPGQHLQMVLRPCPRPPGAPKREAEGSSPAICASSSVWALKKDSFLPCWKIKLHALAISIPMFSGIVIRYPCHPGEFVIKAH